MDNEKPPVLSERQFEDWCKAHQKQVWDRFEAQRDADVEWYIDKIHKQDFIWQQQIEQARQETAREIFEEIEKLPDFYSYESISEGEWQSLKDKFLK